MIWLPKPHVLDLRSLALFRILLGLTQLYDVHCRICNGKYDLAWYTSYPANRSYETHDIIEESNYHLPSLFPFLFKRRSVEAEMMHFAVYTILSLCLILGFKTRWITPVMWLMCTAHQAKANTLGDGSDLLLLQLFLFMIFLPTSKLWSVDSYLDRKKSTLSSRQEYQVESIACLCLTLQIVMMYLGCFFSRTFDDYNLSQLIQGDVSDWMWPNYSLVHYAANGSGVYKDLISDIIRTTPMLNKLMTISGFWIETICPIICFLFNQRYSHWSAIPLVLLHFGIGQLINIPQWAQLGCIIHVVWIPTHVWDRLFRKSLLSHHVKETESVEAQPLNIPKEIENAFSCFLLYLLIATWCASRGWIPNAWDPTAMAQSYGFENSNWDMWTGAPRESPFTMIVGKRPIESQSSQGKRTWEQLNLYQFIKTREEVPFDGFTDDILDRYTYQYPTTRWEKGIGDEWEQYLPGLVKSMGKALCNMVNEDLIKKGSRPISSIDFLLHYREILPSGSKARWSDDDSDTSSLRQIVCPSVAN
jgi:hypothetical protein